MKKTFSLFITVFFSLSLSWAVKAHQQSIKVRQSDNTCLTVRLHGDECFHWYTTTDGVLLFRDNADYFVASVDDKGNLFATQQLAHEASVRSEKEVSLIRKQNKNAFTGKLKALDRQRVERYKSEFSTRGGIPLRDDSSLFPHTGSPKALILLVEFQDSTFSLPNPRRSFEQYFNRKGHERPEEYGNGESKNAASVYQYFEDMSFGKFTPQFDIHGPVRLNYPVRYYGEGKYDRVDLLMKDACRAFDDSLDFSQYDANNDGKVDLVYIVYAGYSASFGNNPEYLLWPKSGSGNYGTFDGKQICRYGINNELNGYVTNPRKDINGIGLFCHEFSHCMGLPDLYSYQGSYNNQGMEYWDLMDAGEYTEMGCVPTAYTAWEREIFGWMDIKTLSDTAQISMATIDENPDHAYKIVNDKAPYEYVVLQNIQNKGWNSGLRGHGLLTYRVSYQYKDIYMNQRPNDTKGKAQVVVLAADGLLLTADSAKDSRHYFSEMAGDTYPGSRNITSIKSFEMYDGSRMVKPVFNIRETPGGIIAFDYLKDRAILKGILHLRDSKGNSPADNRIYDLKGVYAGTDPSLLSKGIYIRNKRKFVVK